LESKAKNEAKKQDAIVKKAESEVVKVKDEHKEKVS
jgi:hypothetical protein